MSLPLARKECKLLRRIGEDLLRQVMRLRNIGTEMFGDYC